MGGWLGIALQLGSRLAYALKFTAVKLLLPSGLGRHRLSKAAIAFLAQPFTGLVALAFVPIFESDWEMPALQDSLAVGCCATGILLLELRLTELTSPLTVAVLGMLHNAVSMLFVITVGEDDLSFSQAAGIGVSTAGALLYACSKSNKVPDDDSSASSAIK